jgi:hypothetical protein
VIYTARLADAVYVLHAFQKKTQATAKRDVELARKRYADQQCVGRCRRYPEQAANLRTRAELMRQIAAIIKARRIRRP